MTGVAEQSEVFNAPIGVAKSSRELAKSVDSYADLSAVRWLFSPFSTIDLSDRPPCGHDRIMAGEFVEIENQRYRHNQSIDPNNFSFDRLQRGDPEGFQQLERLAFDIASELRDAYSETGLIIIEGLTGIKGDSIETLKAALFGIDPLPYARDSRFSEESPVPLLPVWLNRLNDIGAASANQLHGESQATYKKALNALRKSISQSISFCTSETEGKKRRLATGEDRRPFNRVTRRAFLALGEQIPNDLPMNTRNQGNVDNSLIRDLSGAIASAITASQPQPDSRVSKLESDIEELKTLLRAGNAQQVLPPRAVCGVLLGRHDARANC